MANAAAVDDGFPLHQVLVAHGAETLDAALLGLLRAPRLELLEQAPGTGAAARRRRVLLFGAGARLGDGRGRGRLVLARRGGGRHGVCVCVCGGGWVGHW